MSNKRKGKGQPNQRSQREAVEKGKEGFVGLSRSALDRVKVR